MEYDQRKVDTAILALLWLTSYTDRIDGINKKRAWKGHDFATLDRLYEAGYIENPMGKAKSIAFTVEGAKRSKAIFRLMFCEGREDEPEE